MKKFVLLLFLELFLSPFFYGQILTINSGASISVASGSAITLDGLEIAPSEAYQILGNNNVYRSVTAVSNNSNTSVSRVYNTLNLLTNFKGTLTFSYLEDELNDITESELVLQLKGEDDRWVSYTANVNETQNTVSYTFNEAVSFKSVTASAADASLSLEDTDTINTNFVVYPNPTANKIFIKADNLLQAELFDINGRKVGSTKNNQLNMSHLSIGSYILRIKTEKKAVKSIKIIKL